MILIKDNLEESANLHHSVQLYLYSIFNNKIVSSSKCLQAFLTVLTVDTGFVRGLDPCRLKVCRRETCRKIQRGRRGGERHKTVRKSGNTERRRGGEEVREWRWWLVIRFRMEPVTSVKTCPPETDE